MTRVRMVLLLIRPLVEYLVVVEKETRNIVTSITCEAASPTAAVPLLPHPDVSGWTTHRASR
jgi:hypothetical protein